MKIPRLLLLIACVPTIATADEATPVASTRQDRPLAVALIAGFPNGIGLEGSVHLTDRVALSIHAGSWVVSTDLAVRGRYFFNARPTRGLFVSPGLHFLNVSGEILVIQNRGAASVTVGWEGRNRNGIVASLEVGGMVSPAGGSVLPLPVGYFRLGYAF